jgi:hypothetical protein
LCDNLITNSKKVTDSKSVYKIFSKGGILKSYYWDEDLVDLRTVYFPGLNSIDPNLLLEISHIQACQIELCLDSGKSTIFMQHIDHCLEIHQNCWQ